MLNKVVVNAYKLWVVVFVAIGTIASAYGLAIIGSNVGQPSFYAYFNLSVEGQPRYAYITNMISALNSINSADYYVRKHTMQVGCVVLIVDVLCVGAVNMAMFFVGRFIAGVSAAILAYMHRPYILSRGFD
jgi:MFS family permease